MLVLLPILTFLTLFLTLNGYNINRTKLPVGGRHAFLQAVLLLGGYLVICSEMLNLFNALNRTWIAILWGFALFLVLGFGWKTGYLKKGGELFAQEIISLRLLDIIFVFLISLILLTLFFVAFKSPPNNTDSLQYHMSRVMHWAQNQSLRHYPTAFEPQLINPIFTELSILNFRLLWGNDQVANLLQWFCMIGSIVGVSAVAKEFGARRRGQWAAVAFAISVPMGILQATSTQNDYMVAFLLISSLYFVTLAEKRSLLFVETLSLALAVGLGILTKGTAYPYFLPVVIWFAINLFRKFKFHQAILRGTFIAVIVLALNIGYWTRNIITYGGPLGPSEWVSGMTAGNYRPGVIISSLTRNILMNFVTPYDSLNIPVVNWYRNTFSHWDPNANYFELTWGWNHEDLAGSPLQASLVPITLVLLLIFHKKIRETALKWYVWVILTAFLMLVSVLHFDPWGMRYHLPFWITFAPLFGIALTFLDRKKLTVAVSIGFLLTTIPWLIFNHPRPLIAMRDADEKFTIPCTWQFGCTSGTILTEEPKTILFANWIQYREPYSAATDRVLDSGCREIGLRIDSHDLEYVFWWLLDAPQSSIRIESLDTFPHLQRYEDPNFIPCAILCTICSEKPSFHGFDLVEDFSDVRVYMGTDYDPEPNK